MSADSSSPHAAPAQSLPANPDLEWYRKAAKRRLKQMKGGAAQATLAQAQLQVAREQGFSSWRALAEQVALLAGSGARATNYFAHATAAQRYAAARPYFHPLVTQRFRDLAGVEHVNRALDIACGTGQSTVALLDLADEIVGTDVSAEMLAQASPHSRIQYRQADAHALPDDLGTFDLATIALGFHWLDRPRFLRSLIPRLRQGAWFLRYNDSCTGAMPVNPAFGEWFWKTYIPRYPSPPRNLTPFTTDEAASYGLAERHTVKFFHEVQFTRTQMAEYLLTQTNTIAAIEQGSQTLEEVRGWLLDALAPLTPADDAPAGIMFACDMVVYRYDGG